MFVFMEFEKVISFITNYTSIKEDELSDMLKIMKITTYDKNEFLQKDRDICKNIAFIVVGSARAYFNDNNGVEHTVNFFFENKPLTDLNSFFNQIPTNLFAVTMEPTVLVSVSYSDFYYFLGKYPRYEAVLRSIISQYMGMEGDYARLLRITSSKDRYKAFCSLMGDNINRLQVKYIASFLGMASETLSRVRAGKL